MRWVFSNCISRIGNKDITKLSSLTKTLNQGHLHLTPHNIRLLPTLIPKYPWALSRQNLTLETPVSGDGNKVEVDSAGEPCCHPLFQSRLWFCHVLEEPGTKDTYIVGNSIYPWFHLHCQKESLSSHLPVAFISWLHPKTHAYSASQTTSELVLWGLIYLGGGISIKSEEVSWVYPKYIIPKSHWIFEAVIGSTPVLSNYTHYFPVPLCWKMLDCSGGLAQVFKWPSLSLENLSCLSPFQITVLLPSKDKSDCMTPASRMSYKE